MQGLPWMLSRTLLLFLPLLAVSCIQVPKAPGVKEPFWSWNRLTERRIAQELSRAAEAWDALMSDTPGRRRRAELESRYEAAVAGVIRTWSGVQLPRTWQNGTEVRLNGHGFVIRLDPPSPQPGSISPRQLDQLILASKVAVNHGRQRVVTEGLGVPVVGHVLSDQEPVNGHATLPPNGAFLSLTAIIEFDPPAASPRATRTARLRLWDPLHHVGITATPTAADTPPLAADYTAARQLALDRGFLRGFSLSGLLYPDKVLKESRLYQLEPYDPKRIPVVFVHGLMSDPHIWFNCVNAIYADPDLRARYQPWYFLYPTGMAVPSTAARLRESLNEMRNRLDPDHNDPGMNRMVLVGHSMGGLLSRLQTTDSGDAFWNAYFQKKPEDLLLSDDSRASLVSRLKFQRQPYVSRLIFIAVPHHGSELADKGLVMRLAKLIRLPIDTLLIATELMSGNVNALNPQIRDWGAYAFLSLGTLSPRHPYLTAMNSRPVAVPHHSIIGKVGDGPLKDSSDRVVPYSSSHLPTGSEKIVSWWHGCVEHPDVVAEVTRRLHEHLASIRRK